MIFSKNNIYINKQFIKGLYWVDTSVFYLDFIRNFKMLSIIQTYFNSNESDVFLTYITENEWEFLFYFYSYRQRCYEKRRWIKKILINKVNIPKKYNYHSCWRNSADNIMIHFKKKKTWKINFSLKFYLSEFETY